MKKLFALILIALIALAFAPTAFADWGNTTLLSGTQTVPNAASNVTAKIVKNQSDKVALQWSFKLTGAGTSGVLFQSEVSLDDSTYFTGPSSVWVAGNGTTAVTGFTNFSFGPYPFVRFRIHNTNSVVATNWTFRAWTVPSI